jgi:hypothetical protein
LNSNSYGILFQVRITLEYRRCFYEKSGIPWYEFDFIARRNFNAPTSCDVARHAGVLLTEATQRDTPDVLILLAQALLKQGFQPLLFPCTRERRAAARVAPVRRRPPQVRGGHGPA